MSDSVLPDALYYLRNFREAIEWVAARNADLLSASERAFLAQWKELSIPGQALLARLSMRAGTLFRRSKIRYPEIEPLERAVGALIDIGWLDPQSELTFQELFGLTTKAELTQRFGERLRRVTKSAAYDVLSEHHGEAKRFDEWMKACEPVYRVLIAPMVQRFRLLHFGNFWQGWHEYTLAHLQIFQYEPVPLDLDSRPFESREDIEFFYSLHRCYEAVSEGAELTDLLALLPGAPARQGWLRRRFDQLRYHLGQEAERQLLPDAALRLYQDNALAEACVRKVRVLERLGRDQEALTLATSLLKEGASELIVQQVGRVVSRIERRGALRPTKRPQAPTWPSIQLQLACDPDQRIEWLVQAHLSKAEAPVHYVENSLICSLFGLLCWEAIFAPVRGAFFHPFQSGPADLGCRDFVARRRDLFDACLHRLDRGEHATTILTTFLAKNGISAPFVHWSAIDEPTLQLALECIPVEHLKLYFARLLEDLSENATGFPDLAQFFPTTRSYRLIEVKGPGDRLQDNQKRWLHYCVRHHLPVEVCQVSWTEAAVA